MVILENSLMENFKSLLTTTSPPIKIASCFDIVRPNPVPPYFLVVELSAWTKELNSLAICSSDMPIPVSLTSIDIKSPPSWFILSILTVTEEVNDYAVSLKEKFDAIKLRVELDSRNEKIGYKIREHSNAKVPLMAVIGKDEMAAGTVSIRNLRENETNTYSIDEAIKLLQKDSSPPS